MAMNSPINHSSKTSLHSSTALAGQVAIITGASQGIGQAIAHQFARLGIHLVLCARNTHKMTKLAEQLQHEAPDIKIVILPCDVQDAQQVKNVIDTTLSTFERIDILINNAGVAAKVGLLQEMTLEDINRTIDTNLKGAIYFMRSVIPVMVQQQSGTILNINSIAGKTAYPYWALYDASKFGLHAITEAVAEEQRSNNIKVIGIYPGAVDTAIWQGLHLEQEPKKEGMLNAEHIAESVAFILTQPSKVFIKELHISPLQPAL
jgi:3-hydroxy acid dehydrogenase / malonic semialdehyde reductase